MVSSLAPATYNTTNTLGIDVSSTNYISPSSSATQSQLYYPENQNTQFAPGQIVLAGGADEYIFCQVSSVGSINQYDFVAFLGSIGTTFTVKQLTTVEANLGCRIGVAQTAFNVTNSVTVQWCWIATRGSNLKGNFLASSAANLGGGVGSIIAGNLFISTVPGMLSSASAGVFTLSGITNTASTGAGATVGSVGSVANAPVVMTWPRAEIF